MDEIRIIEISIDRGLCYNKDGPISRCERHQWIIKPNAAVCSYCGTERNGRFTGYLYALGVMPIVFLAKIFIKPFSGRVTARRVSGLNDPVTG